jgi:F1F0 ATPase subunit 2
MSELIQLGLLNLLLTFLGGMFSAALFMASLWWSLKFALMSKRPLVWFVVGWFVRIVVVLSIFSALSADDWRLLVSCLLGFVFGRHLITSLYPVPHKRRRDPFRGDGEKGGVDAPQPR